MNNQNLQQFHDKYFVRKFINVSEYFTKKDKDVMKKLNINIEDKLYSEFEFKYIEMDVILYYSVDWIRKEKSVPYKKIKKILDIFGRIEIEYNL